MSLNHRVVYVIGFSAPPVLHLAELLHLLHDRDWDTFVVLSPTAASWVDLKLLSDVSGHPVRVEPRRPQDPDPLPPADAVIAAPLTFNSLNKWSAGISDTLALGLLNEALGLDIPVVAALCAKDALRNHPVYAESVQRVGMAGATVLENVATEPPPGERGPSLDWQRIVPA